MEHRRSAAIYLNSLCTPQYSPAFSLDGLRNGSKSSGAGPFDGRAMGGVEVRRKSRHEIPMNVQLLRGRDLRPPSRRAQIAAALPEASLTTELTPPRIEGPIRKKTLRFPVNRQTRA